MCALSRSFSVHVNSPFSVFMGASDGRTDHGRVGLGRGRPGGVVAERSEGGEDGCVWALSYQASCVVGLPRHYPLL